MSSEKSPVESLVESLEEGLVGSMVGLAAQVRKIVLLGDGADDYNWDYNWGGIVRIREARN